MLVIEPDFTRRIELPGVGACPRPVDIDQGVTGFSDLVSLRIYTFAGGMVIDGEAEKDELFIVLMRGTIDVEVAGGSTHNFLLRTQSGPRAVYLPPHDRYRLHARSDADVAYARARPRAGKAKIAHAFDGVDGRLAVVGYADSLSIALSTGNGGDNSTLLALGKAAGERLIHLRANDGGAIGVAEQQLHDWQTLALGRSESGDISLTSGSATVLVVAAS